MSTEKTAQEKPRRSWWPFGGGAAKVEVEETQERGVTAPKGRATPGRRSGGDLQTSANPVVRTLNVVRDYIEGVSDEIQKVTWPTREDAIRLSVIVIITTVLSSLILGIVAYAFSQLFAFGLNSPIIFLAFFVVVLIVGFVIYRRSNRPASGY